MAGSTTQQQFDAITDAIARGVKEYTLPDGTKVVNQNLDQLLAARDRLQAEINNETRGGLFRRVGFGGGRVI